MAPGIAPNSDFTIGEDAWRSAPKDQGLVEIRRRRKPNGGAWRRLLRRD
jgi:hypothetical protein